MNYSPNFIAAVKQVLIDEGGGLVTFDDGGLTKWGIAERYNPGVDIMHLTEDQAIAIYFNRYWTPMNFALLADLEIASKVFNLAVNLGQRAILCLQRALRAVSHGHGLVEDGILGPATANSVNSCANHEALLCAFRSEAAGEYRLRAALNLADSKWLNGWLARAYR